MMKTTKSTRTQKFIEKYLAIGPLEEGMTYFRMLNATRGTCQWAVARAIKKMGYDAFMQTIYWQLVARQVKHDAKWRCSVTGKKWNLEVHHASYAHHGFEVFNLKDLVCVSHKCHQQIHKAAC